MKKYSIYWTITIKDNNGKVQETTKSCEIIASNFNKAIEWLNDNKEDFNFENIYLVLCSDINIAK